MDKNTIILVAEDERITAEAIKNSLLDFASGNS